MAIASFLSMWLVLLALCLFFAVRPWARAAGAEISARRAAGLPLAVLCGMILTACGAGCLRHLRGGVWLILLAGAAAAVLTAAGLCRMEQGEARRRLAACLTPAWAVAFGGGLLLAAFLAVRQPLPTQWDEFSFWATAAKVVKNNDMLYTLVETTNLEARSYPAALAVLSYLFQWMAPSFTPWLLYAAYGMGYFTVFGAIVGLVGKHHPRWAVFGALACVLCPFVVESWYPQQTLVAYTTAYSDLMMGLFTAGGCAVWLLASRDIARQRPTGGQFAAAVLQTALVIMVLGLVKDVGLPLGLVVMLVCALDQFACDTLRSPKEARRWLRLLIVVLALTLAAGLAFYGWSVHLASALSIDRAETGGSAQIGPVEMVTRGIRELLGIGRSEKFSASLAAMIGAFFARRVSVFGSGLHTVAIIGGILLLAVWLEPDNKRRPLCYGLASGAGFAGYYFFQLICYVYIFSDTDGRVLASYERYMSTYYLFWILGALAVLLCAARASHSRFAGVSLTAVSLALLTMCMLRIQPENTLLGRTAAAWYPETLIQQRADQAAAAAAPDDKVLLVSQWDDSARWYRYAYALDPVPLYHARGDNTIVPAGPAEEYPLTLTADTIGPFMEKNGCTLLLLDVIDYDFWVEFGPLFPDGMQQFLQTGAAVYRMETTPSGVQFVPAEEVQP